MRPTDADAFCEKIRQWEKDYLNFNRNCLDEITNEAIDKAEMFVGMLESEAQTPTIDTAPIIHAYWIDTDAQDGNSNYCYRCSYCNCGDVHSRKVVVPYCWQCGAKMDRGDKDGKAD